MLHKLHAGKKKKSRDNQVELYLLVRKIFLQLIFKYNTCMKVYMYVLLKLNKSKPMKDGLLELSGGDRN